MHLGACKRDGAVLTLGTPWHGDGGVHSPGPSARSVPACQVEFFCSYLSSVKMHVGFPKTSSPER